MVEGLAKHDQRLAGDDRPPPRSLGHGPAATLCAPPDHGNLAFEFVGGGRGVDPSVLPDAWPSSGARQHVPGLLDRRRASLTYAKKRGLTFKPGPPVHDDLVERAFTADRVYQLWLTDITEHPHR